MKKKYEDLWAGILFVAIGILVSTQLGSIKLTNIAMTSRMLPEMCTYILIGLGIIEIIKWFLQYHKLNKTEEAENKTEGSETSAKGKYMPTVRVIACLALFAIFIFLLKPCGFIVSGIVYLLATFFVIVPKGYKNMKVYLISILFPIAVYFIFTKAFSIILPTGTLW